MPKLLKIILNISG